jgi:hypothetical protein
MTIDFKQKQAEFAAYIRDPVHNPAPADVLPQRMAVYHELFFNNIDSFLSSNFPVIRSLLSEPEWQSLSRDFFAHHRCTTPHFPEFAEEFLDYLHNRPPLAAYPFLLELAHYEWVEVALSLAKDEPTFANAEFNESFATQRICLSPVASPLIYEYPVQLISKDYLPQQAPELPTYLIVYRDQSYAVHFIHTTALSFRLLNILEQQVGMSAENCVKALVAEVPQLASDKLYTEGLQILLDMLTKGIIIPAGDA